MAWDNNRPTHVPTKLRRACLERDGQRCTVEMQDSQRCPETTQLEAAHVAQWRAGERLTLEMLTTKCHWHHNRETQAQAKLARAGTKVSPFRAREKHPALR